MKNTENEDEISFLANFHDCRKEIKDCQVAKFITIYQLTEV